MTQYHNFSSHVKFKKIHVYYFLKVHVNISRHRKLLNNTLIFHLCLKISVQGDKHQNSVLVLMSAVREMGGKASVRGDKKYAVKNSGQGIVSRSMC